MTISIDATAGSSTANSFVTEVEQIAYMATRLNASTWTSVSGTTCTETEKAAMVEAARELSMLNWCGRRTTNTQALAWPRWNTLDPDSPTGFLYSSSIVPTRVKQAACELAFQFLKAGTTDIASLDPDLAVTEKTIDVITTRWQPFQRPQGLARFPSVVRFIRPLLESSGSSVPLIRG